MDAHQLQLLLSSAAFWVGSALLVGLLANQVPPGWLGNGTPTPRPAPLPPGRSATVGAPGIRIWKRWIPDAGGALPGGVHKSSLVRRDPAALRRLVVETRRAELVHWALWPAGLLTALWLPPAGVLVNLVFATCFNLPCLLLQRYNRGRLRRCLARMDP
jgi:glycosyl-4,4'-diaponeurosporenoate acyltransferase